MAEGFETAAPYIGEHAPRRGSTRAGKLGRKETPLGRSPSMEPLGHCPIVNKGPKPAREVRCRADRGGGPVYVETKDARSCRGCAERAACSGRMPPWLVMRR